MFWIEIIDFSNSLLNCYSKLNEKHNNYLKMFPDLLFSNLKINFEWYYNYDIYNISKILIKKF
jgi:hypothetical protein